MAYRPLPDARFSLTPQSPTDYPTFGKTHLTAMRLEATIQISLVEVS